MKSASIIGAVLVTSVAVAIPIPASASAASASSSDQGSSAVGAIASRTVDRSAPRRWGSTGSNDFGSASALFSVRNGKVKILNMQFAMDCLQADGQIFPTAFWFKRLAPVRLNRNRYATRITASAGGRDGNIRLRGRFRSNGRGTMRVDMTAVARDSTTNQIIENCSAAGSFPIRRGR